MWHGERLHVPPRQKRKCLDDHSLRDVAADRYSKDVWALELQFDSIWHATTLEVFNKIDGHTRKHTAFTVDKKIDSVSVVEQRDLASLEHGRRPRAIRVDGGSEFIALALKSWAGEDKTLQTFIPPNQP